MRNFTIRIYNAMLTNRTRRKTVYCVRSWPQNEQHVNAAIVGGNGHEDDECARTVCVCVCQNHI